MPPEVLSDGFARDTIWTASSGLFPYNLLLTGEPLFPIVDAGYEAPERRGSLLLGEDHLWDIDA